MDLSFLNDSTLWVGISFIIFILAVIKPITKMFVEKINTQIRDLKKNLDEAKKLKDEAQALFEEHKIKEKKNTDYIRNLKKQAEKESQEIEKRIKFDIEQAIKRKERNLELITNQMESNLKDKLQKEIMIKTLNFTKKRISKDITTKHNDNFIEASLKKLSDNKFS